MPDYKKTCAQCGETKNVEKFGKSWESDKYKSVCRACYSSRERAKLKLDMLNAFGKRCECCGETHPMLLTLEHRIPGQGQLATGLRSHQLYRIARREGWPRDKYECLCFNCNCAKGYFGSCPHRSGITIDEWYQMTQNQASGTGRQFVNYNMTGLALGPQTRHDNAVGNKPLLTTEQLMQALRMLKKPD